MTIPIIALIIYISFHVIFATVTLPNGETKHVRRRYLSKMDSYLENPDENSLNALERLLDKDSNLVFYHDINRESILDDGLEMGNADIVGTALEHGAIFDNSERYANVRYANSMDCYLEGCSGRMITIDDVEIVKIMFGNNVSTEMKNSPNYYSNMFGKAVWAALYNDEAVTDIELEWIQIFVDNGLSSDTELLLIEELPANYHFGPEYHASVVKDSNYYQFMDIIGK